MHRQACFNSGMHSNDRGPGISLPELNLNSLTTYRFFSYYFFFFLLLLYIHHVSASNDVFLSFRNCLFLYCFCSIFAISLFCNSYLYCHFGRCHTDYLFPHIDSAILHRSHSFAAYYPLLHFLCLTSESLFGVGLLRNEIKTIIK